MTFELISRQTIFHGRVFEVCQDLVRLPDGHEFRLDIVDHRPAITILPLDEQGLIWFVRQYRHAAGKSLLELPAGVMEPGETPETGAQREIQEEIGMSAGKLQKIGGFYLAPGYSTEYMHVFLATDLTPNSLPKDEDEFLTVEKISPAQAMTMVKGGQIEDSKSLVSLFLAAPYIQKNREAQ